jgi:hypothetical protein
LVDVRQKRKHPAERVGSSGKNHRSAHRRRFLAFIGLSVACLILGIRPQVIELGHKGPSVWVREGDIVSLRYTQSMYGVPVEERFRVEDGRLVLFEVDTTAAGLEYLGLESRGVNNGRRVLQEIYIPQNSVGSHSLFVGDRRIVLADVPAADGRIRVRLTRQALIVHLFTAAIK